MDSQIKLNTDAIFQSTIFDPKPEASLLLVDWSLGVVLRLASDSLAETQPVQRVFRRVLVRKAFEEEEAEVPEFEGLMLYFGEQPLLGEPQTGLRPPCRFCCRSSPCLVWDLG